MLPSYREAQGLSILEAIALARPVVASKVGGSRDIEDGVTGVLVEPHDAEVWPERSSGITDHAYAETIAGGHDLVHDRFCIELMVGAVEEIYEEGARTVRVPAAVAG